MDLFGFGTPSELTTPIGAMVKAATDTLRISPDWSKNLEICDQINLHRDNPEQAIRAIRRRLIDNDHQVVFLALILLETCMKNCGTDFASYIDRSIMDEMVNIGAKGTKGVKNQEEALRLIQQWARSFEQRKSSFPLFFDTYMSLKSRGVSFPREDPNVANDNTGRSNPRSAPVPRAAAAPEQEEDEFIRLQQDLSVVMEKVRLCREILLVSPGIQNDEALYDIIGYLEACRDRMVDVIEVGTQGMFGEDLFALCLKVNDAVLKTLEAEKNGVPIPVDDDNGASAKKSENLLDLDSPNSPKKPPTLDDDLFSLLDTKQSRMGKPLPQAPPAKQSVITKPVAAPISNDPFANDVFASPAAVPAAPPAPTPSVNPFDAFGADPVANHAIFPPAPPVNSTPAPKDEFDLLFDATPSAQPSTTTAAPAGTPAKSAADEDFDQFFASLDVK